MRDKERNSYSKKEKKEKQNFWKSMKINFGTTSECYYACKHEIKWNAKFISQSKLAYTWAYWETLQKTVFFCHPSSWWLTITIIETEILKLELIIKFPYSKFLISFRNINIIVQFYQSPVKIKLTFSWLHYDCKFCVNLKV